MTLIHQAGSDRENGATEIFLQMRKGMPAVLQFRMEHMSRETTTPHNYTRSMILQSDYRKSSNTPQAWRVLLMKEFEAKLKIIKQDDETKESSPSEKYRV